MQGQAGISQERLRPFLLSPHLKGRDLVEGIQRFQNAYTTHRHLLDDQRWSEDEVTAYTCFYLATNYQKFSFIIEILRNTFFTSNSSYDLIDFGTGPGTYILAYLDFIGGENIQGIHAVDQNEVMLKQAEKLISGLHPLVASQVTYGSELPSVQGDTFVMFGNSLNEIGFSGFQEVYKKLKPDKILFIEPGTPHVFSSMLQVREYLAQENYSCHYPCPSLALTCPLKTASDEGPNWCHQVWRGVHEMETERLGQLAAIDRRSMPMIVHAYEKGQRKVSAFAAQMVRFLGENKHSFNWELCLQKDGELKLMSAEIPKKTLSKVDLKQLKKSHVGRKVEFDLIKEIAPSKWRIRLK